MRHRIKGRRLKRPTPHRLLLLRGLANDLITHEKIVTTTAKAKELARFIEKIINIAKEYNPEDTKASQFAARRVFSFLQNKETTKKLLTDISQRYKDRNSGFVRIVKLWQRKGDGAELSVISFV